MAAELFVSGLGVKELNQRRTLVGLDEECDIVLPSGDTPETNHRALVFPDLAGSWWIVDVKSQTGTFVNNEQVKAPRKLQHGDYIVMGKNRMRFWERQDEVPSPANPSAKEPAAASIQPEERPATTPVAAATVEPIQQFAPVELAPSAPIQEEESLPAAPTAAAPAEPAREFTSVEVEPSAPIQAAMNLPSEPPTDIADPQVEEPPPAIPPPSLPVRESPSVAELEDSPEEEVELPTQSEANPQDNVKVPDVPLNLTRSLEEVVAEASGSTVPTEPDEEAGREDLSPEPIGHADESRRRPTDPEMPSPFSRAAIPQDRAPWQAPDPHPLPDPTDTHRPTRTVAAPGPRYPVAPGRPAEPLMIQPIATQPGYIQVAPGTHSVAAAMILAIFLTGGGQLVNRQTAKGLLILGGALGLGLIAFIGTTVTLGFLGPLFWFVGFCYWLPSLIDAIQIANRLQRGEPVRPWQCF